MVMHAHISIYEFWVSQQMDRLIPHQQTWEHKPTAMGIYCRYNGIKPTMWWSSQWLVMLIRAFSGSNLGCQRTQRFGLLWCRIHTNFFGSKYKHNINNSIIFDPTKFGWWYQTYFYHHPTKWDDDLQWCMDFQGCGWVTVQWLGVQPVMTSSCVTDLEGPAPFRLCGHRLGWWGGAAWHWGHLLDSISVFLALQLFGSK